MATRGRKKSDGPVKTPQQRKAEFDQRMRSQDPVNPTLHTHSPGVYYLSDAATAILRRNREICRYTDVGPRTDSDLLERLLLEYDSRFSTEPFGSVTDLVSSKLGSSRIQLIRVITKLLARQDKLIKKNRRLLGEIDRLEWKLEEAESEDTYDYDDDRAGAFKFVLEVHSQSLSVRLLPAATRLKELLRNPTTVKEIAQQLHAEVEEYLFHQCDTN